MINETQYTCTVEMWSLQQCHQQNNSENNMKYRSMSKAEVILVVNNLSRSNYDSR